MSIAIVTDSACNITPEMAEEHNIYVLPLQVIFGETAYRDGVDLSVKEFYEKIVESDEIPTTSQPSAAETVDLFEELLEQYDHVVSIHLDARLSGTFQTTRLIAEDIDSERITVIDSGLVTLPAYYVVLEAKRFADEGASVEEIVAHVKDVRENTIAFTALNDLDYLLSGGRFAKLAGSIVSKIKIKPIIRVHADELKFIGTSRTEKRAINKLIKSATKSIDGMDFPKKIAVGYGNNPKAAQELQNALQEKYPDHEIDFIRIDSVIGVHTGPEVLGICATKDYAKV